MNELLLSIPNLVLIYWIAAGVMRHRERMALIERGMDPNLAGSGEESTNHGNTAQPVRS